MSMIDPLRIVALWPTLSLDARRQIAEIVENDTSKEMPLELSAGEERLLAQAREDFKNGRALDTDEYHAEMSTFMQRLAAQAAQ